MRRALFSTRHRRRAAGSRTLNILTLVLDKIARFRTIPAIPRLCPVTAGSVFKGKWKMIDEHFGIGTFGPLTHSSRIFNIFYSQAISFFYVKDAGFFLLLIFLGAEAIFFQNCHTNICRNNTNSFIICEFIDR